MSKGAKQERSEEPNEPSAVMERLNWQLAWRDDRRVAQALYAGEAIEEMHDTPRGRVAGRIFCVPRRGWDDGGAGTVGITECPTDAGANHPVCVALSAQSALWGRVHERVAPLALQQSGVDGVSRLQCTASGRGIDQTRRRCAQKQEEARAPHAAMPGRQHQLPLAESKWSGSSTRWSSRVVGWGLLEGERIAALDGSKLPTPESSEGCGKLKQTRHQSR